MLGLGDKVISHIHGVCGVIGDDGNFGRTCFCICPHYPAHQALGCGNENISRPRNHVYWCKLGIIIAVGHQRNGLATAYSPHLIHAKHLAHS